MLMLTTPENGELATFGSTCASGVSGGAPALTSGTRVAPTCMTAWAGMQKTARDMLAASAAKVLVAFKNPPGVFVGTGVVCDRLRGVTPATRGGGHAALLGGIMTSLFNAGVSA